MANKTNAPTIHARELRELVFAAIPSLREKLGDENQAESHRIMGILLEHATRAIRENNVAEVVRIFRFTKELVALDRVCDPYVQSAICASYLHEFRSLEELGLRIFRNLDPKVRDTLYSPFTYPHAWLREKEIRLPGADRWKGIRTIARQATSKARLVKQLGGPCHFAVVRLRLEPTLEDQRVLLQNMLDDTDPAPLVYLEGVIEGVTKALEARCAPDRGISFLRITVIELVFHDVDSHRSDFVGAAEDVVNQCFAEAGVLEF